MNKHDNAVIEIGIDESIDSATVRDRLYEFYISNCKYGCKYYVDDETNDLYLIHNAAYGCNHKKDGNANVG